MSQPDRRLATSRFSTFCPRADHRSTSGQASGYAITVDWGNWTTLPTVTETVVSKCEIAAK